LLALSVNVRLPVREPVWAGLKVTDTVQLAPAVIVVGQPLVEGNSVEFERTLVILNDVA
jgi:hypothetical protein